jgi:dihydroneopterin aldolase
MSLDRITITGLRVHGNHGAYEVERRAGQDFIVDAVLELDVSAAAASDDVADTVHYAELAEALAGVVAGEPVNLLETLATRLVSVCLEDRRVAAATITVHKPQAPVTVPVTDLSVTVSRART